MNYTFRYADGNTVTVSAESEAQARTIAMTQRYGFPTSAVPSLGSKGVYTGKGLLRL